MIFPFFVICECVQITGLVKCELIEITMENHLAVCRERDFSYAINVSRIIHIIIGFYSEPYFSPYLDFSSDCLFPVFRRDGFYLKLLAFAVYYAFSFDGDDLYSLDFRRTGIGYPIREIIQGVHDFLGLGVSYLKMEMRSTRASGIAA